MLGLLHNGILLGSKNELTIDSCNKVGGSHDSWPFGESQTPEYRSQTKWKKYIVYGSLIWNPRKS